VIIVDARGMRCPWPAIRAARALRLHGTEGIEVLADDPAAERELRALADHHGVSFERDEGDANQRYRLLP
jgi:tRNA 2-thiouridine synthesizing protein A